MATVPTTGGATPTTASTSGPAAVPTTATGTETAPTAATATGKHVVNRSGSIMLPQTSTTCSHINVCRPWISWKKGNISEYVTKPRVFFDHFHHQIVLFTGSPPNKMWLSERKTQTWMDYPIQSETTINNQQLEFLPPHNDIIGAQFSPDRSHVALRVSDKEVKVLSTATGEVVTARSCRGTSSRMISVHWIHDPALVKASNPNVPSALFLLFVTNAGVELYELTSDNNPKTLLGTGGGVTTQSSSNLTGASAAPSSTSSSATSLNVRNKLKHIKTATYNIVYHWILLDENILLLVDSKNFFQAYKLSSKSITKICKFELDCAGTSLNQPQVVQFHREQISLIWLYGRMVILFVNEQKGQLHLLSLSAPNQSDEMEQTHVFDLYQPGKYDISNIDNVLIVHNTSTRVSMLFDVRSESKTTITEPLPIGPPLSNGATATTIMGSSGSSLLLPNSLTSGGSSNGINFFDPSTLSSGTSLPGASDGRPSPGMASLAPANFHPYVKWTFLAPKYVWESTGDQQQGNLWTLQINYQQIAFSWPHSKRTRLIDFLLKRQSVQAKELILQIILQIVCTEPASLALLSRIFSLLNRMNYDHRMNPNASIPPLINLASLPLLPPFSNPPSAANTAPSSQVTSPAIFGTRPPSQSVSPYKPMPNFGGPTSPLHQGTFPTSRLTSPNHRTSLPPSHSFSPATINQTSPVIDPSAPLSSSHPIMSFTLPPSSQQQQAAQLSYELDDSLSVLSCEMLDIPAMLAQPLTVEQNLHGYMLISQLDIFLHVFERARPFIPLSQLIPVVVEYLRSLHRHFLKTEDILNDLLVSLLLQSGRHYEFHQYLQYHILNDSLPIANRLIGCAHIYPPAYQLGLDMLYRLNQLPRLTKVLLQHDQVLAALQLVPSYRGGAPGQSAQSNGGLFDIWGLFPRDFLQVSVNTGNDIIFYHTFKFFEQRNLVVRGHPGFVSGDGCDEFVHRFQALFGATTNTSGRASIAGGAGGAPNLSATPQQQYYNLGDDEDGDDEDDDIEYLGEKPSIHAPSTTASERDSPRSSPSASSAASSSEVVQIPAPVDLSTTIGSATPITRTAPSNSIGSASGDIEEDGQAESGLGDVTASVIEIETSVSPVPTIPIDGSFGGSTERVDETTSTPAIKKTKGKFQAEPAM